MADPATRSSHARLIVPRGTSGGFTQVKVARGGTKQSTGMTPELIAHYDPRVPRYTSYPAAPHFKPEVNSSTFAEWLSGTPQQTALSLYLHVTFSRELCFYCGCHTKAARTDSPVASYVELLERETELVAKHLPSRMDVTHTHRGGGTPAILFGDDLKGIMKLLEHSFGGEAGAEIAVEIDPRAITREYVEALAASGLNRASLGFQDLNPEVQTIINRIQSFEETAKVAAWLRRAGVTGLNLGLMYGLPYQTTESVLRTIGQALKLEPDRARVCGVKETIMSLRSGHKIFKTNSIILIIGVLFVISIGGPVEIMPLFYLKYTIEKAEAVPPYTPSN